MGQRRCRPAYATMTVERKLLGNGLRTSCFLFVGKGTINILRTGHRRASTFSTGIYRRTTLCTGDMPGVCRACRGPLPFVFASGNGRLCFYSFHRGSTYFVRVVAVPAPRRLIGGLKVGSCFTKLPALHGGKLHGYRCRTIARLRGDFHANRGHTLVILTANTNGACATYLTTCHVLSCAPVHEVLFLISEGGLKGRTRKRFNAFQLARGNSTFGAVFAIGHLHSTSVPTSDGMIVSAVRHLFSFLGKRTVRSASSSSSGRLARRITLPSGPGLPRSCFSVVVVSRYRHSVCKG